MMTKFLKIALEALASLMTVGLYQSPYRKLPGIEDSWRGDWLRLGADLSRVLDREHEKTTQGRRALNRRKTA